MLCSAIEICLFFLTGNSLMISHNKKQKTMGSEKKLHVILFPYLAQGHLKSFLALALEIEKRKGYSITLVSTPLNVKSLESCIPPSSSIRCREIPFDSSAHGFPPNTENRENVPSDLAGHFLEALAALKPNFRQLVSDMIKEYQQYDTTASVRQPICIIADIFFGWTADIAREFDIHHSLFAGFSGFGLAFYYSLWTDIPHWKVEGAEEFHNHDFTEGGAIHATQLPAPLIASDGTDPFAVLIKKVMQWKDTNGILFNTVEEIDKDGLEYFRRKLGVPIYTIGPIVTATRRVSSHECLQWLDAKPAKSVLYISFGSQNTLAAPQMMELAIALEASERPFIWVVRPPLGIDPKSEFRGEEWLPEGFEQRVKEKEMGMLVKKWAPQWEILSHRSVGGFISHCGWNSALEAIIHEVPILSWPIGSEQFFNAKFLAERVGISVELARGNIGEFENEHMEKQIETLMGENDVANSLRRRVSEVSKNFEDAKVDGSGHKGSSVRSMDDFFKVAMSGRPADQAAKTDEESSGAGNT